MSSKEGAWPSYSTQCHQCIAVPGTNIWFGNYLLNKVNSLIQPGGFVNWLSHCPGDSDGLFACIPLCSSPNSHLFGHISGQTAPSLGGFCCQADSARMVDTCVLVSSVWLCSIWSLAPALRWLLLPLPVAASDPCG